SKGRKKERIRIYWGCFYFFPWLRTWKRGKQEHPRCVRPVPGSTGSPQSTAPLPGVHPAPQRCWAAGNVQSQALLRAAGSPAGANSGVESRMRVSRCSAGGDQASLQDLSLCREMERRQTA
uniref:Uncharacterized protein n=1 Tax=Nothoprocta perdicaria TaxID=30464 RepID=A0A8C6Z3A3_NOTPE